MARKDHGATRPSSALADGRGSQYKNARESDGKDGRAKARKSWMPLVRCLKTTAKNRLSFV